ncbi:hypothetical protein CEXT_419801 [Caerostris extrusa]|uniref:Uncharacterized protein n=1 Tax=Caerostris extrusa TaxID=172846 RepID=A0AAV4TBN6_CAEEX|nr:hypothetical protein CEXT_419801 [Caerostris extrusa]
MQQKQNFSATTVKYNSVQSAYDILIMGRIRCRIFRMGHSLPVSSSQCVHASFPWLRHVAEQFGRVLLEHPDMQNSRHTLLYESDLRPCPRINVPEFLHLSVCAHTYER